MSEELDFQHCIQPLQEGKLIIIPTDTLWCLACDPFQESAVQLLLSTLDRKRDSFPTLLYASIDHLKQHVIEVHPRVETLLSVHTRPLTVLYPKYRGLPEHLSYSPSGLLMQVSLHPFCQRLIKTFGKPLLVDYAAYEGEPYPTSKALIPSELKNAASQIVNGVYDLGEFPEPSVIVQYDRKGELTFIRE